jgi:NitT/TauT family transport system permease protein
MSKPRSFLASVAHAAFILAFLGLWEWCSDKGLLDPVFFGHPSGIGRFLWKGFFTEGKLWLELGFTALGTAMSFLLGSLAAIASGCLFAMAPGFQQAVEPYLTFLNALPRIALIPLFLLWFGLGIYSKIAVGVSLTFFVVLSATTTGLRSLNPDYVALSRSLGASKRQIFFEVTLPSAVPMIFSGLRLGLIFALIGVVGAELTAAEHGLGQNLVYLQSTFNMDGVLGVLFVLALLGLGATALMSRLERKLLDWN